MPQDRLNFHKKYYILNFQTLPFDTTPYCKLPSTFQSTKPSFCRQIQIKVFLQFRFLHFQFITSERIPQDFGFEGIIVMEHYTQGSLLNYLRNNTLSWVQMIRLASCIANGLSFLHRESNKGKYLLRLKPSLTQITLQMTFEIRCRASFWTYLEVLY